jgi:hypothetical protein
LAAFGIMHDMKSSSRKKHREKFSTDAKFWIYLTPFLSASFIVWAYGVSWVLKEAPIAIPRVVASWQSGVQSAGYSAALNRDVSAVSLGDADTPKEDGPFVEVRQEGGEAESGGRQPSIMPPATLQSDRVL